MTYLIAEEFQKFYKHSNFWSHTVWFIGLSYLFIIIVPFFLSLVVDSFWKNSNTFYEQPYINFQGDHLLQCFNGDTEFVSTSIEILDQMISSTADKNNNFLFKVSRVDNNADDRYEFFNIYIEIISAGAQTSAMECSLYLISTFGLRDRLHLQMQSPLHFRLSRPSGLNKKIHIVGDIEFIQKHPLESSIRMNILNEDLFDLWLQFFQNYKRKIIRNNYNYTVPIIPPTQEYMGLNDFILDANSRNETLRVRYKQTFDTADDVANVLSANIFLRVPVLVPVQYVPSLRENLKMIWQYYIYFFIPIYWIVSFIISFSLQNNIFKNSVSNNLPLKQQHDIR